MNHRNLYTEVKPIINRISNHNIEDNLRCIRYYIKESFHSIYNNEDSSKGIENKDAVLIPAYMADFLFVQTLRNGNWVSKISLFNYKERFKVLKNLQVIQEGLNLDCIHDNLEAWLKSSVYTQMKMQNPEHPVFALYRQYYLYSNLKLKNEGQLEEIDVFYY